MNPDPPEPVLGCGGRIAATPPRGRRPGPCGPEMRRREPVFRTRKRLWGDVLRALGMTEVGVDRFIHELRRSFRVRGAWAARKPRVGDILTAVDEALAAGDRDEAVWRAFLANQFGRASLGDGERDSAFELLCGFGEVPVWTWNRVAKDPGAFERWLRSVEPRIATLQFGNHRKRRSSYTVDKLWGTLSSFIRECRGHPFAWVDTGRDAETPEKRFDALFWRFQRVVDWGRLAAFDFGELLRDLKLADLEPGKCYLTGATGPRDAARLIWAGRSDTELETLAVMLARDLGVPPGVLEDALCNWQKHV